MYVIKRFGSRFGKKTFCNYDDARNYLRRYIRSIKFDQSDFLGRDWYNDLSDDLYRNPSINRYGFKIVKI